MNLGEGLVGPLEEGSWESWAVYRLLWQSIADLLDVPITAVVCETDFPLPVHLARPVMTVTAGRLLLLCLRWRATMSI